MLHKVHVGLLDQTLTYWLHSVVQWGCVRETTPGSGAITHPDTEGMPVHGSRACH